MLQDHCPVCPVLSVTLVYCGQMVGWIKVPLGTEVRLGLGHIVLDGDPAPRVKGHTIPPNFRPVYIVAKRSPISTNANLLFLLLIALRAPVRSLDRSERSFRGRAGGLERVGEEQWREKRGRRWTCTQRKK